MVNIICNKIKQNWNTCSGQLFRPFRPHQHCSSIQKTGSIITLLLRMLKLQNVFSHQSTPYWHSNTRLITGVQHTWDMNNCHQEMCDPSLFWSLTKYSALDKTSESPVNVIVIPLLRHPSTLWLASSTKYPMFLYSMHKNLWRKSYLFSTAIASPY